jgi:voltage-gated potassium channel
MVAGGVLVVSAILFWLFERGESSQVTSIGSGFMWVTRTLLQQEPPWEAVTGVGNALYYVVVVTGVGIVALVTGGIASKLVEVMMARDSGMGEAGYENHIIICGWNPEGAEVIRELHSDDYEDKPPVVILAPLERNPVDDDLTTFIRGSASDAADLRRAGIDRARTAIILADRTNAATADDVDARTLLSALAVESINPTVHTCVEVIRPQNRAHFQRAKVDEMIVSAELTGGLLASAAQAHGVSQVFTELTTHREGSEFYDVPVPADLDGRTFREALDVLKERWNCIPVAVSNGTRFTVNPPGDHTLRRGERLLIIGERAVSGDLSAG